MAIKLADTLQPLADFPSAYAKDIEFSDGETLQDKLDTGSLGGSGTGYTQLSQAEYDALSDDEKMNGKEYRTYDSGHIYKLGVSYGKDADLSETLVTYVSISDLNTRKGLSISLVANEDNTQQIIDALDVKEQFVEWFGNSNDRFGINPKTYGDRINELRIIKTTETNAIITAIMNSGAVLSRLYTGGSLGDWTSTGHILSDGYMDDGTISITCTNEDSSGMYGNGVMPETLGFTRDVMTWANGIYRISNATDLVGLPNNLQLGRLEHFNLKRWKGNHNPHTKDWAERMSIFYSDNGNIYTRLQVSGATAGVLTTDTGWRCITQNTRGLVTNAQNFKIDLTKRNASWYGMFTFNFVYGTTPCEITVAITDKVYYTVTKGVNIVSAITYTQDGANYTIGIDLTAKVYGTQVVDMSSEFGVVNSLTDETFAGATTAIYNGAYSMKSYSSLADLGLDTTATINDIVGKMANNSMFVYKTDVFDISKYENLQYAIVSITKFDNSRVQAIMTDKTTGNLYVGKMGNENKIDGWTKVATEEIIHTDLSGNLAGITTVLDLINALLTEYRATSPKKPIRFVSGEITKTTLTDLPVSYGLLQITVSGWDVVEVRLAHSANGFKSMYYGFLTRITGQESISSIDWEKVATTKVADVARTALTFNESVKATTSNALSQSNSYIVRNGICYVSIDITTNSVATDVNTTVNIADGLPVPAQHMSATATPFGKTSTTGVVYISTTGNLVGRSLISNSRYVLSFSYPIAE